MPKLKTNRGAKKRFSYTKTGKIKRNRSGLRHLLSGKSRKRKRSLRKGDYVSKADVVQVRRMLPYS